jgi:hypothetical protein
MVDGQKAHAVRAADEIGNCLHVVKTSPDRKDRVQRTGLSL